jgi:hypothetical protein
VSTNARTYTVEVFRMGATVTRMGGSVIHKGIRQGRAVIDPVTKMARAPWRWTYQQRIPASWPSGVYLAKVSGAAGAQSYAPFVVRSMKPSRYLFVSNTLDYAAYNKWGGSSLYWSEVGYPARGVKQADAVSLDRPLAAQSGAGEIFMMEAPFIAWLERRHVDVTYTTDYDLSVSPGDQPLPKAVVFSGHSEYWGAPLRDWLDDHVMAKGDMNLGVFAADTGYWLVGFSGWSTTGPRTIGLHKNSKRDPAARARCPNGLTEHANAFRSWPCGVADPDRNRPEQALLGVQYGSVVPGYYPYRLTSAVPAALLAGTGLQAGDSLGRIAGGEVDRVYHGVPTLKGDRLFATATTKTRAGRTLAAEAVLRTLPSGGRVFSAGTFWWGWGLERSFAKSHAVPKGFARLTVNLLDFLAGR